MANIWGIVLALFLAAHALVGIMIFAVRPKDAAPSWPTGKSWLFRSVGISEDAQRKIVVASMVAAALLLIGGALGIVGVPGIVDAWTWLVVLGAAISGLALVLYFNPWWLGGIAINVALIVLIKMFEWPTNEALGI